jgi:hypothetical protein
MLACVHVATIWQDVSAAGSNGPEAPLTFNVSQWRTAHLLQFCVRSYIGLDSTSQL